MDRKTIKKEITREGVKLTHPSGVTQLLTPDDLALLKDYLERAKARVEENLARLEKDMQDVQKSTV